MFFWPGFRPREKARGEIFEAARRKNFAEKIGKSFQIARKRIDKPPKVWYNLYAHLEEGCNFFVWSFVMAVKTARAKITFECTECKHRNYDSLKNKKNDPDRLVLKKYCPFCKKHTEHKEAK